MGGLVPSTRALWRVDGLASPGQNQNLGSAVGSPQPGLRSPLNRSPGLVS